MRTRIMALLVGGTAALSGCGLLDVDNPNNQVEDDIRQPSAANAVVNGAFGLVGRAIGGVLQPYSIIGDELTWIGSRDAWLSLDQGFISDPNNEFTDGVFPWLGQARWMADEAVEIMEMHVADGASVDPADLARAYFVAGLVYTFIGEVQEDFAFSDKTEAAPPVGPANMITVFDEAIARLDKAVSQASALGEDELHTRALAARARAKFSRAAWQKIKPSPNTGDPLVSAEGAAADASAAMQRMGLFSDWKFRFTYSSSTYSNDMAGWINSRAENQFGAAYVSVDPEAPKKITGFVLNDPIDGIPDPRYVSVIEEFIGETSFAPLTWLSEREMHLIIAEHNLANGNVDGFRTHINHVRDNIGGMSPFTDEISNVEMLEHERRVNLFLQGRRLVDMYRFGTQSANWLANGDAMTKPGTLLPITIVEILSNPHIN